MVISHDAGILLILEKGFRRWHRHFIMLTEQFTLNENILMMDNSLFQVEHKKLVT